MPFDMGLRLRTSRPGRDVHARRLPGVRPMGTGLGAGRLFSLAASLSSFTLGISTHKPEALIMLAISLAALLLLADEPKPANAEKPDPATEQANRYLAACEAFEIQIREHMDELKERGSGSQPPYMDLIKGYPLKRLPIVQLDFPSGLGRIDVDEVGTIAVDVIVDQVLGPDSLVANIQGIKGTGQQVIIEGIDTARAHEGRAFHLPDDKMFDAVRQETRPTANGGTKTLVLLEARDRAKLLADATAINEARNGAAKASKQAARIRRPAKDTKPTRPVTAAEKQAAAVRLKMGAARAKLAANDREGAERFAREAVKLAEGTDLADQAAKVLDEITNPQR